MQRNEIVDRETWTRARVELLREEKAHTRARDELAAKRRSLPWVRVEEDYRFIGPEGEVGLADLFGGKRQLIVYHFMFAPDWDDGCPSCSFWADTFDRVPVHLAARDTALVCASRAPLEKLTAARKRFGWSFPWYSTVGDAFNRDFGVTHDPADVAAGTARYNYTVGPVHGAEEPGASVFAAGTDGAVFHTYSVYARGVEDFNGAYRLLDMTPKGRDEGALPFPMAWVRRRDGYS